MKMELDTNPNKFGRYRCPCCEYYTFREKLGNTYNICTVCYWEDDELQLQDPTEESGANYVSLGQAKENFKEFGVAESRLKHKSRSPDKHELPD